MKKYKLLTAILFFFLSFSTTVKAISTFIVPQGGTGINSIAAKGVIFGTNSTTGPLSSSSNFTYDGFGELLTNPGSSGGVPTLGIKSSNGGDNPIFQVFDRGRATLQNYASGGQPALTITQNVAAQDALDLIGGNTDLTNNADTFVSSTIHNNSATSNAAAGFGTYSDTNIGSIYSGSSMYVSPFAGMFNIQSSTGLNINAISGNINIFPSGNTNVGRSFNVSDTIGGNTFFNVNTANGNVQSGDVNGIFNGAQFVIDNTGLSDIYSGFGYNGSKNVTAFDIEGNGNWYFGESDGAGNNTYLNINDPASTVDIHGIKKTTTAPFVFQGTGLSTFTFGGSYIGSGSVTYNAFVDSVQNQVVFYSSEAPGPLSGPVTVVATGFTADVVSDDGINTIHLTNCNGTPPGGGDVLTDGTNSANVNSSGSESDTFHWDNTLGEFADHVSITGSAQTLSHGVTGTFGSISGYDLSQGQTHLFYTPVTDFSTDTSITGSSGATADITVTGGYLILTNIVNGPFGIGDTITGNNSTNTATVTQVTSFWSESLSFSNGRVLATDGQNFKGSIGDVDGVNSGHFQMSVVGALATPSIPVDTSGSPYQIPDGDAGVGIDPGSPLPNKQVILPQNPVDGQHEIIEYGGTIPTGTVVTTMTVTAPGGSSIRGVVPVTSIVGSTEFIWRRSGNYWFVK